MKSMARKAKKFGVIEAICSTFKRCNFAEKFIFPKILSSNSVKMSFSLKTLIFCVIVLFVANDLGVDADDDDNDKPTLEADTQIIVDWVIIFHHIVVVAIRLLIHFRS